jgi:hypothetical protein
MKAFFTHYWHAIALGFIIISSFIFRAINLNYNSPFNDEAIYVVLGRLGIFQGDWWSYNAASWMAGQPYIYPSMSALSYMLGGIVGSRFLNVLFGALFVEAMYLLTVHISPGDKKQKIIAGLISALIVGFSAIGYYISRLATYDLPSFYFFILSIVFLLRGSQKEINHGKWHFCAAVFLFLAFATKIIIGVYIPIIFLVSFIKARGLGKVNVSFWLKYFVVPFFVLLLMYISFNFNSLLAYASSQSSREYVAATNILKTYWENTSYVWYLWGIASIGLLVKKQIRLWAIVTLVSTVILATHLLTHRWSTLDKHTFLSVMFLAPLIGIGLTNFIYMPSRYYSKVVMVGLILGLFEVYILYSYLDSRRFNEQWGNSNKVLSFLSENTKNGDRILAEVGAGAILVNYDKNYPSFTTTFDWFEYKGENGEKAYLLALKDGYFDLVEIDGGDQTSELIHSSMHNIVLTNMGGNYNLVYDEGGYLVYKKAF